MADQKEKTQNGSTPKTKLKINTAESVELVSLGELKAAVRRLVKPVTGNKDTKQEGSPAE